MPSSRSERRSRDAGSGTGEDLCRPASRTSTVRTALAALLVLAGIAWLVAYTVTDGPDATGDAWAWMGDLGRWNYLIGFSLIFLGLSLAAHPSTPMGRGRGVLIGMLGCFLVGVVWIVVYYVTGLQITVPLLTDLAQYNLVVGVGFMAVGFVYATRWE